MCWCSLQRVAPNMSVPCVMLVAEPILKKLSEHLLLVEAAAKEGVVVSYAVRQS